MLRYLRPFLVLAAALPAVATLAAAQGPMGGAGPSLPDSLYLKAQRLVVSGNGADGRALVDSLYRAAEPGSPEFAEALYWKAALADNAADAERGYLKLTIEYPLSPRTEAALLRLGQLELTRGNRVAALSRFERAAREFPNSPQRAHSWYTIGRIKLEDGRTREGCLAIRDAQSVLPADDVELRNKVDYLGRQCVGVSLEAPAGQPAPRPSAPAAPTPAATSPAAPTPVVAPTPVAPSPVTSTPAAPPVVTPPAPTRTTPRPPTAPAAPAAPARGAWSVQVAAFDRPAPAQDLAEKLRREGFDARVDADDKWHRVRIGHYPTRAAAAEEARALKASGVTGFVTGAGE